MMTKSTAQMRGPVKIKAKCPVVSGRVPASLAGPLKRARRNPVAACGVELAWHAGLSFEWTEKFGEVRQLIADARRGMTAELLQHMISEGWTAIHTSKGVVWAPPGSPISELVEILKKSFDEGRP